MHNSVTTYHTASRVVYNTCTPLYMFLQDLKIAYSFAHCSLRDFCLASHLNICKQRHNQGDNVHSAARPCSGVLLPLAIPLINSAMPYNYAWF